MNTSDDIGWFSRLVENPHITLTLVTDNQGRILRSAPRLSSNVEQVASMVQSFEALAQSLASALHCGEARMLQFTTDMDHTLVFPLFNAQYFLAVQIVRKAPLMLVMVEMERVLHMINLTDMVFIQEYAMVDDETPVLDAAELIDAVREWLQQQRPG